MEFNLPNLVPPVRFKDPDKFIDVITYRASAMRIETVVELPKTSLLNAYRDQPARFLLEFTAQVPMSRNQLLVMPIGNFEGIRPFNAEDSFAWNAQQELFLGASKLRVQEILSYIPRDIRTKYDGLITYRDLGYTFS